MKPSRALLVLIIVLALAASVQIALIVYPAIGIAWNALFLIILLLVAVQKIKYRMFLLMISVIPSVMMATFTFAPSTSLPQRGFIISLIYLFLGVSYGSVLNGRAKEQSKRSVDYPFIIITGVVCSLLMKSLSYTSAPPSLIFSLPLMALADELYLRKAVQTELIHLIGMKTAIILTTICAGILYIPSGYTICLSAMALSCASSLIYARNQRLLYSFMFNIFMRLQLVALPFLLKG